MNDSKAAGALPPNATYVARIEALVKLKLFDEIISLTSSILSKFAADSKLTDSLIVLNLVLCEVKTMTGRGSEAIQMLCGLEKQLQDLIQIDRDKHDKSVDLGRPSSQKYPLVGKSPFLNWLYVIWSMKINLYIRQYQWHVVLIELQRILQHFDQESFNFLGESTYSNMLNEINYSKISLLCLLIRVCVQVLFYYYNEHR